MAAFVFGKEEALWQLQESCRFMLQGPHRKSAISDIIDYVANPQKTDNGRLITGFACDSRTVDAEFLLAKRQCIAATGRVQGRYEIKIIHKLF